MPKPSKKKLSKKISLLVKEGKPVKQAAAIAYSMLGKGKK